MTVTSAPRVRSNVGKDQGPRLRLPSHARHAKILEMLRASGAVSVTQAAADLGVSDMTLRRDLIELEGEGVLTRVHGGAVAAATLRTPAGPEEPSFDSRMLQEHEAKLRIANEAASLVAGCRALAIDVGTTTFMMAQAMRPSANMKVFTSSVRVAVALASARCEVYLAGGRVRGGELAVGGPAALTQFGSLWFDAAVIGASGLTVDGLFDYSIEDTELKRIYIERSALKIAVCDSSKAQRQSLVKICGLDEISTLVTDAPPPEPLARALADANVKVVIV
jgi:DeoR/GlpR family transcriptional regulator of sugar metabolism